MELVFNILAVIFFVTAAYFYSTDSSDRVFFAIVLAICSLFLAFRYKLKDRLPKLPPSDEKP